MDKLTHMVPDLEFHYELVKELAKGGNSIVWSIKSKDNTLYACKIPIEDTESLIIEEAIIMSRISKYPNQSPFLTFYGIYSYKGVPVNVTELFDGVSLNNLIDSVRIGKMTLTESQIFYIAKVIFQQLAYLHNMGLNHGDIHSNNILYNEDRLVLIDLSNKTYNQDEKVSILAEVSRTRSEYWNQAIKSGISPSVLLQKKDIFDAGIVLMELMGHDFPPWNEFILDPNKYRIISNYPKVDALINLAMNIDIIHRPSAHALINLAMNIDIIHRPSAHDLIDYINKYYIS